MDDDSPEDVAHRAFARQVFGDHPLGRDTAGTRDSVRATGEAAISDFFDRYYRAANTVVAVAGAIDPDEIVEAVAKCFDPMPDGGEVPHRTAPPALSPGHARLGDETEQVHLVAGGRALARDDDDREALDVVNHVLGGGLSSRLFDEIRERRGLAYSVFSTAVAYADDGSWSVHAGTLPEHATEVERLVAGQIERLADGITPAELEVARGYLTGSYEMSLEDSGTRMMRLGGQLTLLGRLRSVEEQIERWSAVSLDDVDRVIEKVYGGGAPVTVSLGPV
jgi:predicted Zn-dependent peptidase